MYLIDTDTLLHYWAGRENVVERFDACDDDLCIASVTKAELLRKCCENLIKASTPDDLLLAQARFDREEQLIQERTILRFDTKAAKQFGELNKSKKLRKIGRADLLISSIALSNNAALVTRNLKHFRQVPRLKVENWVD